jgi:hypothetical protein
MNYGANRTNSAQPLRAVPAGSRTATLAKAVMGLSVALVWGTLGCHRTHAQDSAFSYQGNSQDQGQPDNGNLAPVDGQYAAQNEAQQQATQYQQGAPIERRYPGADTGAYPPSDDPNAYNNDQPATDDAQAVYDADLSDEEATQAPPPLPDYDQPPPPDPDYLWTPGYWAWSPEGYYWVPGAWVEPPYVGALWTPGYWAFYSGRYRFHHGFWGLHIGFYGGINYGFGYTGYGYYGGYWRGGHFFYNREVNHIGPRVIGRVYDYHVREDRFAGRPSFNGPRGITVRPRPAEIAVLHERRYAPLPAQTQLRQQSMQNRQQFYSDNHGRPATTVAARPVMSNHQMPAALPQPNFGGRSNGYRGDRGGQGAQPAQPAQPQVQPTPQGRIMPQRGGPQSQPQQNPNAGRQEYRGAGRQQQSAPGQAAPAPAQPQRQLPGSVGAWQQRHGAPVQPQAQPQPQQDLHRGGSQGGGQPQAQPRQQPQAQQQFRRGPEGARMSSQPQPAPQQRPQPQEQRAQPRQERPQQAPPQQHGHEDRGHDDHNR